MVYWNWEITNLRIIPVSVEQSEVKTNTIPDTISRANTLQRNCTDEEQSFTQSMEVSTVVGSKLLIKQGVSTKRSGETKMGGELFGVKLEAGAESERRVDLSEERMQDFQTKQVEREEITVKVPPLTARLYSLEKRVSHGYFSFKGKVRVDADIQWVGGPGNRLSPIAKGSLASLYPTADSRMFDLAGEIWNATAHSKVLTYVDEKLDKNDKRLCPSIPTDEAIHAVGQPAHRKIPLLRNNTTPSMVPAQSQCSLPDGAECYRGPCELPLNGYREVCTYVCDDDEWGCNSCGSLSDSQCEAPEENDQ